MVITITFGKLYVIEPVFSIDYGGLGALFLSHYLFAVKGFFWSPPFWEGPLREWACKKLIGASAHEIAQSHGSKKLIQPEKGITNRRLGWILKEYRNSCQFDFAHRGRYTFDAWQGPMEASIQSFRIVPAEDHTSLRKCIKKIV